MIFYNCVTTSIPVCELRSTDGERQLPLTGEASLGIVSNRLETESNPSWYRIAIAETGAVTIALSQDVLRQLRDAKVYPSAKALQFQRNVKSRVREAFLFVRERAQRVLGHGGPTLVARDKLSKSTGLSDAQLRLQLLENRLTMVSTNSSDQ